MKPREKNDFLRLYDVHKNYKVISEVGAGTYGRVYKAICTKNNKYVALKKIDMSRQELDGFPITAIREIKLLRMLSHKNIITLLEIIMSRPSTSNKFRGSTYLVFEYMDHDFVGLMTIKHKFKLSEIKCIMKQMLEGLKYLHSQKIIHRDMKSANILLNNSGEVKIADFGLARQISPGPNVYYTNKVVTLWYRAPELLLGSTDYSTQIDIWSLGCIFAELLTGEVLFKGDKEARQLEIIYEVCGSPDKINWPEVEKLEYYSSMGPKSQFERKLREIIKGKRDDLDNETLDFLDSLLIYDPKKRHTAETALVHPFFKVEPLECSLKEMPRIEKECHETLLRTKKVRKEETTKNNEINEKIGIAHEHTRTPPLDQPKNSNFKDFKDKPYYKGGFDDNKPFYHGSSRGGFKGGNMRGNTFYKRGFHQEGGYKGGFSGGLPSNNFRGGYQGNGYRKFSNSNMTNNEINNNEKPSAYHNNNNNGKSNNGNEEQQQQHNEQPIERAPVNEESSFISEKKQQDNELRQMLRAHMLPGGLKSLIQNQTSLAVGGLKDEERESFKLEEVVEPPNHDPNALKFENLVENKVELPPIQPVLPAPMLSLDKGIFTEHRIKRKDPNAGHGGNPGEAAIKKVHME